MDNSNTSKVLKKNFAFINFPGKLDKEEKHFKLKVFFFKVTLVKYILDLSLLKTAEIFELCDLCR